LKRNLKEEIKVSQLSGYVSEKAYYKHGEISLQSTIIGMAQDFVGSNNVPFLQPQGQFGTRLEGGKDSASPRYISTLLTPITRLLFHKDDDFLLEYLEEEGQSIEPKWYLPIIPTVLVNGNEGIGTGWSSNVSCYNPSDIVYAIKRLIEGKKPQKIQPWFNGFKGKITKLKHSGDLTYETYGQFQRKGPDTIIITELPIKKWTSAYKNFILKYLETIPGSSLKDYSTDKEVKFEIKCPDLKTMKDDKIYQSFKLISRISCSNMHLYNDTKKTGIVKYQTVEDILTDFFAIRIVYYQKRIGFITAVLDHQLQKLESKLKFVKAVVENTVPFKSTSKAQIIEFLTQEKYYLENKNFDYLLDIKLYDLTTDSVASIEEALTRKKEEVTQFKSETPQTLYWKDLDAFLEAWDKMNMSSPTFALSSKEKTAKPENNE
jgi:DNA topoisomerase-2